MPVRSRSRWAPTVGALMLGMVAALPWPSVAGPVVVELYTSQGCNTCPPADAYLGELAARDDVIALSVHVNYWDYLGWQDSYATEAGTERQRSYSRTFRQRYVYTPQMVIHGMAQSVGHDRSGIELAIDGASMKADADLALTVEHSSPGVATVRIPASDIERPADVLMFVVDRSHTVAVAAGENSGKSLTYYNVVRSIDRIGSYDGTAGEHEVALGADSMAGHDLCVVVVQEPGPGAVLGAVALPLY